MSTIMLIITTHIFTQSHNTKYEQTKQHMKQTQTQHIHKIKQNHTQSNTIIATPQHTQHVHIDTLTSHTHNNNYNNNTYNQTNKHKHKHKITI